MFTEEKQQFQVKGWACVGRDPLGPLWLLFLVDGYCCGQLRLRLGQGLEIIRGCQGLKVVGCDLVEVSPPYDPFGE